MSTTCRLCLGGIVFGKVAFNIDEENGLIKNVNNIREMLLFCAPEVDIYISYAPVTICENCLPTLVGAYNFKVKCMNTENTIRSYVQKNKIPDGQMISLRSVVNQIGKLYQTGDVTAGVRKQAIQQKKKTTIIDQNVLSMLKKPTTTVQKPNPPTTVQKPNPPISNASGFRTGRLNFATKKTSPSPKIITYQRRTKPSLPRLAKEKEQDIQVVGTSEVQDETTIRSNAAPGTLRQDRRMAYLGLKRKSPEKSQRSRESPDKIIMVLDDDPPTAVQEKPVQDQDSSLNDDNTSEARAPRQGGSRLLRMLADTPCKPGETVLQKFNEVTITRKASIHESEICEIESSDDDDADIEIIEPNHPMIDLVNETTKSDENLEGADDGNNAEEIMINEKSEKDSEKEKTADTEDASSKVLEDAEKIKATDMDESSPKPKKDTGGGEKRKATDMGESSKKPKKAKSGKKDNTVVPEKLSLVALKNQYQHLFEEHPEFEAFFQKELVVNLPKMKNKKFQPTRFLVKVIKSKLYGCKWCTYGSLVKAKADDHMTYKHTLKGYYFCKYCPFRSKNLSDLGEHANLKHLAEMLKYLQENSKDILYLCTLCDYKGGNMLDLRYHRKDKHLPQLSNGTFVCPYQCEFLSTSSLKSMHKHIEEQHEGEHSQRSSIFHCHICKYEVDCKANLARHLGAHKKSKNIKCLLCPFGTKSEKLMDKHMKKHSNEEDEASSGLVFFDDHMKKTSYNDDYRITLDSLRQETQHSYRSKPSSSSHAFDGPSLSEFLLVGLSENFDYVDLTDGSEITKNQSAEIAENETFCINDEVVQVEEEEEPASKQGTIEMEVPSSTSDEIAKNNLENVENTNKTSIAECADSEISKSLDSSHIETTEVNDEEHISTTTYCEDEVSAEIIETIDDEDSIVEATKNTELDKDHRKSLQENEAKNSENNDAEIKSVSDCEEIATDKLESKSENDIEKTLEEKTSKTATSKTIEADSVDESPTKLSTTSEESNVSSGTSDLTKNVIELEDSIRELNNVLEGNMTGVKSNSKVSESIDDAQDKTDSLIEELDNICQDIPSSKEDDETNKTEDNETKEKAEIEPVKIVEDLTKETVKTNSTSEDKMKALEKRCFMGTDVKKITALEERFFKRTPGGSVKE